MFYIVRFEDGSFESRYFHKFDNAFKALWEHYMEAFGSNETEEEHRFARIQLENDYFIEGVGYIIEAEWED